MEEKLKRLDSILVNKKNPVITNLLFPEKEEDIKDLINACKLSINKEFLDFFMWKDGIDSSLLFSEKGYEFELSSFGNFFEIRGLLSHYTLEFRTGMVYDKKYLAIFFSATGDRILIDLCEKSSSFGKLFIFAPSVTLSDKPMQIFESISSMIETIIECYENMAYIISEGKLTVNYELESKIAKRINPNAEFWQ